MGPRAKKKEEDELGETDFYSGFRGGSPLEVVPPPHTSTYLHVPWTQGSPKTTPRFLQADNIRAS